MTPGKIILLLARLVNAGGDFLEVRVANLSIRLYNPGYL